MATHTIPACDFAPSHSAFRLRRIWHRVNAMLQAQRSRRLLTEMDSRLLADIGASRADAAMEANRPFWDIC